MIKIIFFAENILSVNFFLHFWFLQSQPWLLLIFLKINFHF